jgi:hypothetical protein
MKTLLTQFNSLKAKLNQFDLYQPNDEVDLELAELETLIVDTERRQALIEKTATEIEKTISNYTESVDGRLKEKTHLNVNDHDSIQCGANEILILCDLEDNTPYDDEWFPKEKISYEDKLTYHIVGVTYLVDEATSDTLEENLFDSLDAIVELVVRKKGTWRFSEAYVDTLIHRFNLELEKEIKGFYVDGRSGSCYIAVAGSEKVIYCTPFHEEAKGVPISVDVEGDSVYDHLIEYHLPTNLRELENFKKWYKELVLSLFQQY